jgi:hypothetical protein
MALAELLGERFEVEHRIITAAPGMGKSRLGAEFVSRVQQRGQPVAIWVGRGDSLRAGSTLDLLAQALRSALDLHGGEPLAERRDQIRDRIAGCVRETEHVRVAAFLGELVGAPFPDDDEAGAALRAARQDAQLMSEQMRKAWLDFLDAETSAHPILLVLEDLHWGDFGTARFIDTALRDRGNRPWMVLALARPEVFEAFPRLWADSRNVQEIRLKELSRKAGERLVRQVLGDSAGPKTIDRLVERAEGNALYLEELIRTAAEGKDDALPETVLAMVETRLDRLPIEARRVLRAASVFGEVCWESGVAGLLGGAISGASVAQWIARLVEQEVLAARPSHRFAGEQELMFRHALHREGAYATLTDDDKRLGHRIAGEWLQQHGEVDPMVLAGHFNRGGQSERAARYYLRASEQAMQVLDLDATMARADLGLACSPPPELRLDLLGMRCEAALQNLPRINETLGDAEELKRSAPRGSLPWLKGMIIYNVCTFIAGRIEDLLASLALLREVDPAPDAARWMALALLNGIHVHDTIGRVPESSALEKQFRAIARSTWDQKPSARYWWHLAVGLRASYADEDPWTGLVHSDAMQTIFEEIGGDV